MRADQRLPLRTNEGRYLQALERLVGEYMPFQIESGATPELVIETGNRELIAKIAELMARRMVTGVQAVSATSWRQAARQSMQGKRILQALRTEMGSSVGVRVDELVARQVKLIERIPDVLARQAQLFIGREQRRGVRADAIAEALRKRLPQVRQNELRMLARTGVGRAETALTQARSERLGLDWYEWATSEDQRVRPAHRLLDHVLVRWSDAPSPEQLAGETSIWGHYHPGGCPWCRCLALPLVDLDEVRWPHKVYEHGQIAYMGRAEFERQHRRPDAA